MTAVRYFVEERVHILRGTRRMFVQADTVKRGDVITDPYGMPLRDRKSRRLHRQAVAA